MNVTCSSELEMNLFRSLIETSSFFLSHPWYRYRGKLLKLDFLTWKQMVSSDKLVYDFILVNSET
ncbi:hypothetical protein YC2023_030934 [Brassica napus]